MDRSTALSNHADGVRATRRAAALETRWAAALGILVAVIAALPLVVSIPAPLQDWPGHLARVHILDELLRGVGPWGRYYDFNGFLLPNVALDLGVLGLVRAGLPLGAAGAVFLLAVYAVFVGGFVRMSAAFGARSAATPMLGAVVFYNTALFWGFVNFSAALGVSFWVIAWWMGARRPGGRLARAALGSAATVACHIVPAVILVGVIGLLDLVALARGWRAGVLRHCTSLAGAATVAVLLLLSPTGADGFVAGYVGGGSVAGFLHWKAQAYAKALLSGGTVADGVTLGFGLLIVGAVLVLAATRRARLSAGSGAVVVVLALALLPVMAPQRLGAGSLLDYRLAVLPFVFGAAAMRVRCSGARGAGVLFALIMGLVVARTAALAVAWRGAGVVYAQAEAAFAGLPPASLLLAGYGERVADIAWTRWWTPPVAHLDTLGAVQGLVVPTVFALASQQPLVLKPALAPWSLVRDMSTPALFAGALGQARMLCGTAPDVSIAVLYPAPFMAGPGYRTVNPRLSIVKVCGG